jgi:hypothetical protein
MKIAEIKEKRVLTENETQETQTPIEFIVIYNSAKLYHLTILMKTTV